MAPARCEAPMPPEAPMSHAAEPGSALPDLLDVSNLFAGYGEANVLHGLDFVVEQGGVTALLGANGAGKTTRCAPSAASSAAPARFAWPARASTACPRRRPRAP